ncbi:MAG: RNA methyltransferase [Croceitalea sp.]|nr:RNA methyltransferase [Croceitalea sp.]
MFDHQLLRYLEGYLTNERKARFEEVLTQRTNFLTVAIEDVFQLHNTSAVIRSCDAFGIQNVHVVEARYGKRLDKQIAMGAEQWVDVQRYKSTKSCLEALKSANFQIIATTPHDNAVELSQFELTQKTALFFGTEKEGLSQEILNAADGYITIPMNGFTESLNVSVAAAIILQDLGRKLRVSSLDWRLTEIEKNEKRMDWTKKSIKDVAGIIKRFRSP